MMSVDTKCKVMAATESLNLVSSKKKSAHR